jgi:hypothetical protein
MFFKNFISEKISIFNAKNAFGEVDWFIIFVTREIWLQNN